MEATYSSIIRPTYMSISDWIAIVSAIVNVFITIWIVRVIQNKLTNRRILKDHLIGEVKELRIEYVNWIHGYFEGEINSSQVVTWFKLMNIKTNDLLKILHAKYSIETVFLSPYQIELRSLVTESDSFINSFKNGDLIHLQAAEKNELIRFQQNHSHIFNDLIVKINDAKNNA